MEGFINKLHYKFIHYLNFRIKSKFYVNGNTCIIHFVIYNDLNGRISLTKRLFVYSVQTIEYSMYRVHNKILIQ